MKLSLRCSQYSQQIPACLKPISYSGKDTATAYQPRHAGMYPTAAPTHSILHPLPTALPAPWHPQASCILSATVSLSHNIPCPTAKVPEHSLPDGIHCPMAPSALLRRSRSFLGKRSLKGMGN